MPLKIKWLKDTVIKSPFVTRQKGYAVENKVIEGHLFRIPETRHRLPAMPLKIKWLKDTIWDSASVMALLGYAVENKVIEGHPIR